MLRPLERLVKEIPNTFNSSKTVGSQVRRTRRGGLARLHRATLIVALVELLIFAGFHPRHPAGMGAVPINGALQAFLEWHFGRPSAFSHELGARKRIAAVVAGAVADGLHQALGLSKRGQDLAHHLNIR